MTLLSLGELAPPQSTLEQGIALYDPQQHHASRFLVWGYDPGVDCLALTALSLWMLGYPGSGAQETVTRHSP